MKRLLRLLFGPTEAERMALRARHHAHTQERKLSRDEHAAPPELLARIRARWAAAEEERRKRLLKVVGRD